MQNNFNTLFIIYNRSEYKFECPEIKTNQNLVPNSYPILKKFLTDLNNNKLPFISRYWYFSFIFLILYIVLFFLVVMGGGIQYIFIPLIFFILFIASMITNGILTAKWTAKFQSIKEKYENRLKNYYKMEKVIHFHYYRRRRRNYNIPLKIKLFPIVNGNVINLQMINPLLNGVNPMVGQMMYNQQIMNQQMMNQQMMMNSNQMVNNNPMMNINQNGIVGQNGNVNQNGIVGQFGNVNQNGIVSQNGIDFRNGNFSQNVNVHQNGIVNGDGRINMNPQNPLIYSNNNNRIPINNVRFNQVTPLPDDDAIIIKKEPAKRKF